MPLKRTNLTLGCQRASRF